MERERETIGEGSSSSREQRNLREKHRRMLMKDLYLNLSSHVSPAHRLPVPQLIDQAKTYLVQLKEKVDYLTEKKKSLQVLNRCEGSLMPKLSISSQGSTIEMNLITHANMKKVKLHELVRVFEEEGAQVMSANLQNFNDRTIFTIIAQAIICRIGIDPLRIEERVKDLIS